jgi:beta-N-acetylhexosaminidase
MVSHAAYPAVTKEATPASLSKKWITDVLRKKIGYRGLIASDDLEMGGVLAAAPIEQAAVGHIRAGGDLGLICHKEEFVTHAYEELIRTVETDRSFARRANESIEHVLAFKKKNPQLARWAPPPTNEKVQALSRRLWEFSEQVRLDTIHNQETA